MKKDSRARVKGAQEANQVRTSWEEQAIAVYAQFLHERPKLTPKERRYAVATWMNENSTHPKRITDAMMLAALRRPETRATLAAFKEMFETPSTDMAFTDEEEREISTAADELTRVIEAKYSNAFRKFAEAMAVFKAACIEASRADEFAAEVQRAIKVARDKAPARAKGGPAKK